MAYMAGNPYARRGMSAGAKFLIVVFFLAIIIGGAVYFSQLTINLTNDAVEFGKLFFDAQKLKIQPKSGEEICDLKITTHAKLVNELSPQIEIDPNRAKTYQWFDCRDPSNIKIASLLDMGFGEETEIRKGYEGLPPLDFLFLTEEKIHGQIVLKSGATKVDAVTQPTLRKVITIPAGIIKTGLSMDITYVVSDIPNRDYVLEIYYGRQINNLEPGKPFIDAVGKFES